MKQIHETPQIKPTVLMTAYAVNPYKGSEDGSGWNIIRHVAEHTPVIAITRKNNAAAIRRFLKAHPLPPHVSLHFAYYDLPYWMRFWKRGSRGAMLYHYLWHMGVVSFIRRKGFSFDIAHHLNFHNDWTPSFLWLLGKPLVWGPVGHHHKIPSEWLAPYGRKAWLADRRLWVLKKLFWKLDPFLKITLHQARKVLAMNSSVRQVLPLPKEKEVRIPPTATEPPDRREIPTDKFRVLSIGRFVPLKGFDVTIRAFARFYFRQDRSTRPQLELVLIGRGPERARLAHMARQCGLPDQAISFVPWLDRQALSEYYNSASAFLFPSHEGAGMVVVEALSYALPVLCFRNYGPGEFTDDSCAFRVPYTSYEEALDAFARGLERLLHEPALRRQMGQAAYARYLHHYTYQIKARQIVNCYREIMMAERLIVSHPPRRPSTPAPAEPPRNIPSETQARPHQIPQTLLP